MSSLSAVPFINLLTLPIFLAEVRGKSLLYADTSDYGWPWLLISATLYMAFNDFAIYWIHRLEHNPSVYKYIHKPHHKWIGKFCLLAMLLPSCHFLANIDDDANNNSSYAMGCASLPPA